MMHDPDLVAFDIPRPWPSLSAHHDRPGVRFEWRYHHRCDDPATCDGCQGRSNAEMFPWWKPRSYSKFMTVFGKGLYWPAVVTVWHHDPGDYDCFDQCPRDSNWQWHVRHWRVQVQPLQQWRRRLLTCCEWCGGRSRKRDHVNVSHSWDREPRKWWQGEGGLYHADCESVASAWRTCTCESPVLEHAGYGQCARCSRFRGYGQTERWRWIAEHLRLSIPERNRDRVAFDSVIESAPEREVS